MVASDYSRWFSCTTDLVTECRCVVQMQVIHVSALSTTMHTYCCQIATVSNICWVCNDLVPLACQLMLASQIANVLLTHFNQALTLWCVWFMCDICRLYFRTL